ncbi:uncharacterized protein [Arachis hypogaea]|uniref:uncharacterized protein n=1 Tax=Arachis hypogaea TaxID=3818 RepID=UPI003B21421A
MKSSVQKLSPAEIQSKRENGLCYWCDEKFLVAHRCPNHQYMQLQLVLDDADGEDTGMQESLESEPSLEALESQVVEHHLSYNAMHGTSGPALVRVNAIINGLEVQALIDGGSLDSFIQPCIAKFLNLPIEPASGFKVIVGSFEVLPVEGCITSLDVNISGCLVSILEVYVLHVAGGELGYKSSPSSQAQFHHIRSLVSTDAVVAVLTLELQQLDGIVKPPLQLPEALHPALKQSAYIRDFYAITEALAKFRPYLLGKRFILRTDHQSLKPLLEQDLHTPEQHKWLHKLLGFDFEIHYKAGTENIAADALSRSFFGAWSVSKVEWLDQLRAKLVTDEDLRVLLAKCNSNSVENLNYSCQNGLLLWKNRLVVPSKSTLVRKILYEYHNSVIGGHAGIAKTVERICSIFYWPHMQKDIRQYVLSCCICQQAKIENKAPAGLLKPLLIPSQVWEDIAIDFIVSLLVSSGYSVIMVVVDRLTKYAYFLPLKQDFNSRTVAESFINNVVKLHGFPKSIISDRDRPYRQHSVALRKHQKLVLHYFGPFPINKKLSDVAYRVELPPEARIHNVFHVSALKRFRGEGTSQYFPLPLTTTNVGPVLEPSRILSIRSIMRGDRMVTRQVQWGQGNLTETTWEDVHHFHKLFPEFNLEDKVVADGDGNDTNIANEEYINKSEEYINKSQAVLEGRVVTNHGQVAVGPHISGSRKSTREKTNSK